jgi:hypothetical protein
MSSKFHCDILTIRRAIEDSELRYKVCNSLHCLELKYVKTGDKIVWDYLSISY